MTSESPMPFTYACEHCGQEVVRLQRARSKRVFCSPACHDEARVIHRAHACPQCGKTFRPQGRGNPARLYCSRACYEASRARVTKQCSVCGSQFTVGASQAKRYTACSRACRTRETRYVACGRCGKRFRAEKRLNRRYCSEVCRRPPVMATCRTCGREFRHQPCVGAQFCRFACYRRFRGENRLEAKVRAALQRLEIGFAQEQPIGRWSVDFALIDLRVALEVDGDYWHARTAARDARRDAALVSKGWRIVRITETEVQDTADLDRLILGRLHPSNDSPSASTMAASSGDSPISEAR